MVLLSSLLVTLIRLGLVGWSSALLVPGCIILLLSYKLISLILLWRFIPQRGRLITLLGGLSTLLGWLSQHTAGVAQHTAWVAQHTAWVAQHTALVIHHTAWLANHAHYAGAGWAIIHAWSWLLFTHLVSIVPQAQPCGFTVYIGGGEVHLADIVPQAKPSSCTVHRPSTLLWRFITLLGWLIMHTMLGLAGLSFMLGLGCFSHIWLVLFLRPSPVGSLYT